MLNLKKRYKNNSTSGQNYEFQRDAKQNSHISIGESGVRL